MLKKILTLTIALLMSCLIITGCFGGGGGNGGNGGNGNGGSGNGGNGSSGNGGSGTPPPVATFLTIEEILENIKQPNFSVSWGGAPTIVYNNFIIEAVPCALSSCYDDYCEFILINEIIGDDVTRYYFDCVTNWSFETFPLDDFSGDFRFNLVDFLTPMFDHGGWELNEGLSNNEEQVHELKQEIIEASIPPMKSMTTTIFLDGTVILEIVHYCYNDPTCNGCQDCDDGFTETILMINFGFDFDYELVATAKANATPA
jgi:hypothetical protein